MTDPILDVVRYVYNYMEHVDCSCEDPDGTCWYHMDDDNRIQMLARACSERFGEPPERRAFLEAAEALCEPSEPYTGEPNPRDWERLRILLSAYRTMKEAERGDKEA